MMDRRVTRLLTVFLLSWLTLLAGCATDSPKSNSGMIIGGLLGAALGSATGDDHRTERMLAGALLGGAIGRSIGKHMDEKDREKVNQSLEETRPGETSSWTNEKSGNSYDFTPGEKFSSTEGYECREFVQEAIVNGKREKVNGTACKEPDTAQWKMS